MIQRAKGSSIFCVIAIAAEQLLTLHGLLEAGPIVWQFYLSQFDSARG
jgi:hypothetical protein